jgi:purine nucleosidase
VPLDVTTRVQIRPADVAALRAAGDRFHEAVAVQVERYPRFAQTGATLLHDPMAAAVMLRPDLVELMPARIEVETHGRLTAGMTLLSPPEPDGGTPARVAITVDVPAAERFIRERLVGPVTPISGGE